MRWMLAATLLTLVALLAGCSTPAAETTSRDAAHATSKTLAPRTMAQQQVDCGHSHVTFAIFLPGEAGEPHRVDFAAPLNTKGRVYYDYASGSSRMTLALHMHQTGDEVGNATLGPAQWHMESPGECVQVQEALRLVDVESAVDRLALAGGHTQVEAQRGTFIANATSPLRWWLQSSMPDGEWTWQEKTWDEIRAHELLDGESLLVALGSYSDAQVVTMQAMIPAPISRPPQG